MPRVTSRRAVGDTRRGVATLLAMAALLALAACSNPGASNIAQTDKGSISIDKQQIVHVRVSGKSVATVDASHALAIGGKPVALSPRQQHDIDAYYNHAVEVITASANMGQDGTGIAKSVLSSLSKGDIASIGENVSARVGTMMDRLKPLCEALDATYDAQSKLVSDLGRFGSYAVIEKQQVIDCRKKIDAKQDRANRAS